MNKETPPVLDDNLNDEMMNIVEKERKDVRREKFDLSSTRVVLDKLLSDGLIKPDDKLSDVMAVIEKEFKRIEDI
ncbi:MAG: hypothetical protein HYT61_04005 [Candidatus Yanofskybacteria bacterium]|nr:hypothetical protein [Candidatus Yanofskybacteria bacterium]